MMVLLLNSIWISIYDFEYYVRKYYINLMHYSGWVIIGPNVGMMLYFCLILNRRHFMGIL